MDENLEIDYKKSPFSFLQSGVTEIINIVHTAILAESPPVNKDGVIRNVLNEEQKKKYDWWKLQMLLLTYYIIQDPPEVWNQLTNEEKINLERQMSSGQFERIESLYSTLSKEEQNRLKPWYERIINVEAKDNMIFSDAKRTLLSFLDDNKQSIEASNLRGTPSNVFNILILGETGVGKTTFINAWANYLKYGSLEEALEKKPIILADVSYSSAVSGVEMRLINVPANGPNASRYKTNENFNKTGQSSTQEPLIHTIQWQDQATIKYLRLIDTPGANDTRGNDQDNINLNKILKFIEAEKELHAICILLRPNESRLSSGFRKCLDFYLQNLHSNANKNIIFCFTNTRSTLYRVGETLPTLQEYLADLKKSSGVDISTDQFNMFCFENDCFRYMCQLMLHPEDKSIIHQSLLDGWPHNRAEMKKLLLRIQRLVPHTVEKTANINAVKQFSEQIAPVFSKICKDHLQKRKELEKEINSMETKVINLLAEESCLAATQKFVRTEIEHTRTICTSPQCSDLIYVESGRRVKKEHKPKKICYEHSPLIPKLGRSCFAGIWALITTLFHYVFYMDKSGRKRNQRQHLPIWQGFINPYQCSECHCSWKKHIAVKYQHKLSDNIDDDVKRKLKTLQNNRKSSSESAKSLEKELKVRDYEFSNIASYCYEIAAFMKINSLKNGIDPCLSELTDLIKEEENIGKHLANNSSLNSDSLNFDLDNFVKEYKKKVQLILQNVHSGLRSAQTSTQLLEKVSFLKKEKYYGWYLSEIQQSIAVDLR